MDINETTMIESELETTLEVDPTAPVRISSIRSGRDIPKPVVSKRKRASDEIVEPAILPTLEEVKAELKLMYESDLQVEHIKPSEIMPLVRDMPKWLSSADLKREASKPINWVVDGMWTEGAKILLAAEQKVGKTFLVCSMCIAMASGKPLWGCIPVLQSGPVGVIAGEDDEGEIGRRMDRMCRAQGLNLQDLPIKFLPAQGIRLNRPRDQDFITRSVEKYGLKMVVYDPLSRLMDGDENSKEVVANVLNPASQLARDKKIGVCIVHHLGKQSSDNPRPAIQRVRGSSDITSWFSCGMLISGSMRAGRVQVELVQRVSGKLPGDFLLEVIETEDPSIYGLGSLTLQARLDDTTTINKAAINEKLIADACCKIIQLVDGEGNAVRKISIEDGYLEGGLCGVSLSDINVHYQFGRAVLNSALKRLIRHEGLLRFETAEDIPDRKVLVRTPKYNELKRMKQLEYLFPSEPVPSANVEAYEPEPEIEGPPPQQPLFSDQQMMPEWKPVLVAAATPVSQVVNTQGRPAQVASRLVAVEKGPYAQDREWADVEEADESYDTADRDQMEEAPF